MADEPTVVIVAPASTPTPETPAPPALEPERPAIDPVSAQVGALLERTRELETTLPERIGTALESSVAPLRGDLSALTARVAALEPVAPQQDDPEGAPERVIPDIPPPPEGVPIPTKKSMLRRVLFG